MVTQKAPSVLQYCWGLFHAVIRLQWHILQGYYRLELSVKPFANIVGYYTRQDRRNERKDKVHHHNTPFPYQSLGAVTYGVYHMFDDMSNKILC